MVWVRLNGLRNRYEKTNALTSIISNYKFNLLVSLMQVCSNCMRCHFGENQCLCPLASLRVVRQGLCGGQLSRRAYPQHFEILEARGGQGDRARAAERERDGDAASLSGSWQEALRKAPGIGNRGVSLINFFGF